LKARGDRPFGSLADFAERVDLRQINRRGLECLTKVGALSDLAERGRLLAAIDRLMAASATAHEAREVGQLALFAGNEAGMDEDLLTSLPDIVPVQVSPKEALEWEKELVGVYVSSHPLQRMTVDLINVVSHSTIEITEELANQPVILAGIVTDVRQITTKKGEAMAFIRMEDLQGPVDVTVFPQLYRDNRGLWSLDKIVIVRGKVDVRNGRVSVLADSVQDYVEGMKVIDDTSSVAYRFRNGEGDSSVPVPRPNGPDTAGRSPSGPRSAPLRYAAPGRLESDSAEDAEPPDLDTRNPFSGEEPEWLDARTKNDRSAPPSAAVEPLPADEKPERLSPAEEIAQPQGRSDAMAQRVIKITFRRSQSLEADRRRLSELVDVLSSYAGEDRFEIVVEANGSARFQLEFPNNRTLICRELQAELTQRLGAGGWKIAA
jgi:DNA polymerase-3 subunit alpha